jgi:hypothetical protein
MSFVFARFMVRSDRPKFPSSFSRGIVGDYVGEIDDGPPLFTLLCHLEMYVDGWCLNGLVWWAPHAPVTPNFSFGWFQPWNCWVLCSEIEDVGPSLFTLSQPEMPTDGVWIDWCDQPLKLNSLENEPLIWGTRIIIWWEGVKGVMLYS